jgi:rhodanese-related sulfurtransferase
MFAQNLFAARTPTIDVNELETLIAQDAVRVLDVRDPWEFAMGHVPDAIHIPMQELPARLAELAHDKPYAVICASGGRSEGATDFLIARSFVGAMSVWGGTSAWARSGRPIVR